MNKKLFTNATIIKANQNIIYKVLKNPEYLLKWIPDITNISKSNDENLTFTIIRSSSSLIPREVIKITEKNNTVIYNSINDRLEYQLIFSFLNTENEDTKIQEELIIQKNNLYLPLKLLSPIAKRAFQNNLENLVNFIEKANFI